MKRHVFRVGALVSAVCFVAPAAHADKLTDAEELFRRAKALMAAKKPHDACPLLEESQRLDPQMGTLLNLAICHESIGKIASAWGEFRAVEQQARAVSREDRVRLAQDRATKLEPRLPRIKIVVSADANVHGLVIKVDGEPKGEPLWAGVAVDPGTRSIEASAPGKKTATFDVLVGEEGAVVPVDVPRLEDDEPVADAAPIARAPDDKRYAANRARRSTGFIIGGAGAATLAAGGVFGVLAVLADGDATDACPRPCIAGSSSARTADASTDRALLFANIANVTLPIGLIAAALGGYVVLSAGPTAPPTTTRAFLLPRPGGGAFGVSW